MARFDNRLASAVLAEHKGITLAAVNGRDQGSEFSVVRWMESWWLAESSAEAPRPIPSVAQFPPVIGLGDLDGTNGFRMEGIEPGDEIGWSVSSAGDVNGDGIDDIIVGAPMVDANAQNRAGQSYVVFGRTDGFSASFDLTTLDGANGFRLEGNAFDGFSGWSVASAGDFNGDGFSDIIIGAPGVDLGGNYDDGQSYVVFGGSGRAASVALADLDGANGFRLDGLDWEDASGWSVASAGDVNGDGYDDIVVGAPRADVGSRSAVGETYVVFGTAEGMSRNFNLAGLDGSNGFRLIGIDPQDNSGSSVASAGDVNGDGFSDIVINAPRADGADQDFAGESYVVFGRAGGFAADILLSSLDGSNGFRLKGIDAGDASASSVASAGDINGDGFDDVILGTEWADPNGVPQAGETYIVFGKAGGFDARFELAGLDGSNGFRLDGLGMNDVSGRSVSSAGDVNGDGFDDIIIGAPYADRTGGYDVGESYVIFGKADPFDSSLSLADLDGANGFRLEGIVGGDRSGGSVASAGDVNRDGFGDILIGATSANGFAGGSYVLFGQAPEIAVQRTGSAADQSILGGDFDDILSGQQGDDALEGGGGADSLNGGDGLDWASYRVSGEKVLADLKAPQRNSNDAGGDSYASIENLRGSSFNDALFGDDFANRLEGLDKNDLLSGRGGKDALAGGAGRDKLKGGEGNDRFELASLDAGDADKILDFTSGDDRIALDGDVFGLARVKPGQFVVGSAAGDVNDRLIYDDATGKLFFDADGTGAQAKVLIATFTGAPALGAADFVVI